MRPLLAILVSEVETRNVHWQTGNAKKKKKKGSGNVKLFEQPNVSPVVFKGWLVRYDQTEGKYQKL